MPKPLPAIMLAVLANVLLLAHSLVPHHHHGERVCFDVGSCNTRERQHHHEGEGCDDSGHPAGQEEGCCVLDHLVIFHPEGFRHELEEAGQPAELDFPLDFQWPLIHYYIRVSLFAYQLPFRQHPPSLTYHSSCLSHGLGLRAPPVV